MEMEKSRTLEKGRGKQKSWSRGPQNSSRNVTRNVCSGATLASLSRGAASHRASPRAARFWHGAIWHGGPEEAGVSGRAGPVALGLWLPCPQGRGHLVHAGTSRARPRGGSGGTNHCLAFRELVLTGLPEAGPGPRHQEAQGAARPRSDAEHLQARGWEHAEVGSGMAESVGWKRAGRTGLEIWAFMCQMHCTPTCAGRGAGRRSDQRGLCSHRPGG